MRLADLDGRLVAWVKVDLVTGRRLDPVMTLQEADGVAFLCPACFQRNGGAAGTHTIVVYFADRPRVPATARPTPRWNATGTTLADLTLSPSIDVPRFRLDEATGAQVPDGSCWHGFVRNGEAA